MRGTGAGAGGADDVDAITESGVGSTGCLEPNNEENRRREGEAFGLGDVFVVLEG